MSSAAAFRSAFEARLRARRAAAALDGARRGGTRALWFSLAVLALAVLGILPPPPGPVAAVAAFAAVLLIGTGAGAALAVSARGGAEPLAREMDLVLREPDLVATAAAVASRPGGAGRFGEAVVDRAAEAVAGIPADRLGPLPRPPWRLLGIAALVAILLAILPKGGFGLLPGFGAGWGTGGSPDPEQANWGKPGPEEEGKPKPDPEAEKAPEGADGPKEKKPDPPPVASLEARPLARRHRPEEPILVGATIEGLAGAGKGADLELAFSVDGGAAAGEGRTRRVAAGERVPRLVDLRGDFAPLRASLKPGTRRVVATLRDAAGKTVAEAPPFEIKIDGKGEDGGKDGEPKPKPQPKPTPAPEPESAPPAPQPEPPPKPPSPAGTEPEVAIPPSELERRVVNPLFGEGPQVVKKGPILVLDPDAGRGAPPREMDPQEAVAEVRARAEEAARREGADPRDLETVRRYFEALRRIVEGGR